MTYNVDLMLQVREQITSNPETHDQDSYENGRGTACGTTRCIAGWAIYFANGCKESIYEGRRGDGVIGYPREPWEPSLEGKQSDMLAAELMGLNFDDMALFFEFNEDKALAMLDALIEKGKNQ